MKPLTLEHLLEIHVLVIGETGGLGGLRDLGRLESAIAAQTQHVFGEEIYPTLYDKAAAVIRGIIADHPFVDGNKRTAMLAGLTLLEISSVIFKASRGEIENFAVKMATEHLSVAEITAWLKIHSKEAK